MTEASDELLRNIVKLGLIAAKNTDMMMKLRQNEELLDYLITNKFATGDVMFYKDIIGRQFLCPKCGNPVSFTCPRGICGYCSTTVNINTNHSKLMCQECAGHRKGECKHPEKDIHHKL